MPSMQNVAAYAGVSIATVSKVMQGDETVRAENVVAVQNAIEALGYRINPVAAELRRGRRKLIGVVVAHLDEAMTALARAIEFHAHRHGYATWVECSDGSDEREGLLLGRMRDWRVAGLVLSQVRPRGDGSRLLPDDVTTVSVGGAGVAGTFDGVVVSAGAVAKELARGLFHVGCRDLLAVGQGSVAHHSDDLARHLASAWEAVAPGSIPRLVRDIIPPDPMLAAARLADRLDGMARPTGVLAFDPVTEALVSSYAFGRGIKVPDKLRIVVCRPASRVGEQPPRLVVVDYPADEIAAKAVDLLLLRIGEPQGEPAVLEEPLRLSGPLGGA